MTENKIPFKRFYNGCAVIDGDYFKEMEQISLEDIRSLSRHDLNKIPISWLYDFAEVHGLLHDDGVRDWIERQRDARKRVRSFRLPQGKSQVILSAVERGKRVYTVRGWNYYSLSDGLLYREGYGDIKVYSPTAEQLERMNDLLRSLIADCEDAKAGRNGFTKIKAPGGTLFFRRLPDFYYRFITELDNGFLRQRQCKIKEFLESTCLWCATNGYLRNDSDIGRAVADGTFELLNVGDMYMAREIKYLYDCATTDEVEYLNAMDGKCRFINTKQVYDVEDLTVLKCCATCYKYSHIIRCLEIEGKLCGQKVTVIWQQKDTVKVIAAYKAHDVRITPELKQAFQKLWDDEEEKIRKRINKN